MKWKKIDAETSTTTCNIDIMDAFHISIDQVWVLLISHLSSHIVSLVQCAVNLIFCYFSVEKFIIKTVTSFRFSSIGFSSVHVYVYCIVRTCIFHIFFTARHKQRTERDGDRERPLVLINCFRLQNSVAFAFDVKWIQPNWPMTILYVSMALVWMAFSFDWTVDYERVFVSKKINKLLESVRIWIQK